MRRAWDFLFDSDDLPWGLQVFWKVMTLGMSGVLFYAATTLPTPGWGRAVVYTLAGMFVLIGLFTKLGES